MLCAQPMSSSLIKENNANEGDEGRGGGGGGGGGGRRERGGEINCGVLSTEHYAKYFLQILDSRLTFRRWNNLCLVQCYKKEKGVSSLHISPEFQIIFKPCLRGIKIVPLLLGFSSNSKKFMVHVFRAGVIQKWRTCAEWILPEQAASDWQFRVRKSTNSANKYVCVLFNLSH